jgi:hypothetical protein
MTSTVSDAVKQSIPLKRLRQIISLGALLLGLAHIIWPTLAIDFVALGLIIVATLPWLSPLVKSLELPGGWKVEFAEISKQIIEDKIPSPERGRLTRHQVVSSMSGEISSYKLYSNGILTQRVKARIMAGKSQTNLTFPVAFPNEVTSIQVVGDLAANVTDLSSTGFQLNCPPQSSDKDLVIFVSGL